MSIDDNKSLAACGCCRVETSPTPEVISNRPGLSAIHYRVGTYSSFLEAMKEAIAKAQELRQYWTARSTTDYGIALMAMWAYVADILTFYQERIANEAYLRTALQQESVTALAALLGYKPSPGAAAETEMAFFLDKQKKVQIPIGLRVQSVPGQNEKPQKFETVEAISADAAFNQLQIFPEPQAYLPFAQGSAGAVLLSAIKGLARGTKLAMFDESVTELKQISDLPVKNTQQLLDWTPAVQTAEFLSFTTRVAPYNRQFRMFGNNAPSSYMQPSSDSTAPGGIAWTLVTSSHYASTTTTIPTGTFALDAKYNDIKPGSQFLISDPVSSPPIARLATVTAVASKQTIYGPLQDTVSWVTFGMAMTGGPVAIIDPDGEQHVFVVGDDAALWHIQQESPDLPWSSWKSFGGKLDLIDVAMNQDGTLEVFARGVNDHALWHRRQNSAGGSWSSWSSLGGRIDLLAVASNQNGALEVFARGGDKALWHIAQTAPNGDWGNWASLGGEIDLLVVGSNQDGRLEVFARGSDKALWHIAQTAPNNGWGGWASLGGVIELLAVGSNQDGRLEVFARGTDKGLWHIAQTAPNGAPWGTWASLGGEIDLLAVGSQQDGRLDVFGRGTDKALWHITQNTPNGNWGGWASLGGGIDLLAVTQDQDGAIDVFARGSDQALYIMPQNYRNDGWGSWYSLGVPMWAKLDPTQVTLFELTQPPLQFYDFEYGDSISGATLFIPVAESQAIPLKRTLILDDAASTPETVNVTACNQIDTDGDGQPDHWAVAFAPDLSRSLRTSTAFLYGNVALATHGQTVANEVVGSGDASRTFQTFRLKKNPVTFVHASGAPNGVADTLKLLISGVYWKEVEELYGHLGTDRVYTTSIDDQGMLIQLGDGITGAQAPTGRNNIVATYRQGIGVTGNVASNTLKTLLDKPVGLKTATNPGAANGGSDPESLDQERENAPNTVRTFGRIVSLEDFQDQARQFAGIAKALAVAEWSGEEQVVYLTVAGANGAEVVDPTYSNLVNDLNSRRDPNRSMRVRSFAKVNIQVAAQIDVSADRQVDDVKAAVQAATLSYLSFDNLQFGEPVHLSGLYSQIQAVDGVVAADVQLLQFKSASVGAAHGATGDPVQDALRANADELLWIDDPDTDVVVTAGWSPS